jgi:hypothetical protein
MYRLRNCQNKSWSSLKEGYHFWTPSLTGKMDPLPKLFVTPEENQYAMALLKNTNFKIEKQ